MKKHYIYALIDPRDNKLKYVGYSVNPKRRLREHTNLIKINRRRNKAHNWCLHLYNNKMKPVMKILEICGSIEHGAKREDYWIRFFRKKGCDLKNTSDGGKGIKGMLMSKDDRKRISESVKKYYKNNPEEDKKMRERFSKNCHQGRPMSEANKQKLRESNIRTIKCNENNKIYNSLKEASIDLNIQSSNICKVLKGQRKTTGGFTFSYMEGL